MTKNIFKMIDNCIYNYNKNQENKTYGDILESGNKNKMNSIKQMCNYDEYELYNSISLADKSRILNENNNRNFLQETKPQNKTISGIAEVTQLC